MIVTKYTENYKKGYTTRLTKGGKIMKIEFSVQLNGTVTITDNEIEPSTNCLNIETGEKYLTDITLSDFTVNELVIAQRWLEENTGFAEHDPDTGKYVWELFKLVDDGDYDVTLAFDVDKGRTSRISFRNAYYVYTENNEEHIEYLDYYESDEHNDIQLGDEYIMFPFGSNKISVSKLSNEMWMLVDYYENSEPPYTYHDPAYAVVDNARWKWEYEV